ncbi:Alpha-ketoglutarate-dependent dioxygenase alkB homolog 6 [Coccomyxa sp. Obi]|nr:Alpha-ketoglutarate-dependent dioxygenase alkB homolog 6 [Coccomyxa sp. Obi]
MLEAHRVGRLPDLFYIPDFVSIDDETRLVNAIGSSKAPWIQVSGRRLRNYGGTVHEKLGCLLQSPVPNWLQPLLQRMAQETGAFGPGEEANHVLLNAYRPGEGIMPHQDGPLYHPGVCILSLAAPAVMRFTRKRSATDNEPTGGRESPVASVVLMPRSLLVFCGDAYHSCLHGIDEVETEVLDDTVVNRDALPHPGGKSLQRGGERFSLTVRRVLRTKNILGLRK